MPWRGLTYLDALRPARGLEYIVKIVHIVADGKPGGGTTVVMGLVDAGKEAGASVSVVTESDSYALREMQDRGVPAHGLPFQHTRFNPLVWVELLRIIKRLSPDIIHVHGSRAALPLALFRSSLEAPIVYTIHGFHFFRKPPLVKQLAILAEKVISSRADHTVYVCHNDHTQGLEFGIAPEVWSVVYNGVDIPSARPKAEKEFDIGFLGRLVPQKNPLLFLGIARDLREKNLKALIIGGGQLEDQVTAFIEKNDLGECVTVTGIVPHEEALEWLEKVRVLVMTSAWEGFPLAPLEAMVRGIPVVASDVNGLNEVVVDRVNGYLVREGVKEEFETAIASVLVDDDLVDLAARSRESVENRFTTACCFEGYLEIYTRVLEGLEGS